MSLRQNARALRALLVLALVLCHLAPAFAQTNRRLIDYADPFVGTENGGNIVPGAQVPFGFVHASPDTERPTTAGYNPYENIRGFSQTHVSGTGGASKYGNFLTVPHVGKLRTDNLGSPKAEESAAPGYYSVRLTRPEVKAELTATRLVAQRRIFYTALFREKYLQRSKNWMNVWSDETRSARPRFEDGRWLAPFTAAHFYPDREFSYWDAPFYEGSGYIYGTYVPHDAQGLIKRLGGDERFVAWLDDFFDNPPTRDAGFNPGLYNHNNEPNFLAPFLYTHAGRPDRAQERARRILDTEYRTGRGGLPGNDDSGAMSSWYVWGAVGLYPNAGQPFYYIASPIFERSTIDLGSGRAFVVEARDVSGINLYVQSATLNGRALERAWLRHEEVAAGGRLVLRMGPKPTAWGRDARPPSMSLKEQTR